MAKKKSKARKPAPKSKRPAKAAKRVASKKPAKAKRKPTIHPGVGAGRPSRMEILVTDELRKLTAATDRATRATLAGLELEVTRYNASKVGDARTSVSALLAAAALVAAPVEPSKDVASQVMDMAAKAAAGANVTPEAPKEKVEPAPKKNGKKKDEKPAEAPAAPAPAGASSAAAPSAPVVAPSSPTGSPPPVAPEVPAATPAADAPPPTTPAPWMQPATTPA